MTTKNPNPHAATPGLTVLNSLTDLVAERLASLADKVGESLAREAASEPDVKKSAEKRSAAHKAHDASARITEARLRQKRAAATRQRVAEERTAAGRPIIDPVDASAQLGTQRRRIKAHNALLDLARPGTDRFCGYEEESRTPLRGGRATAGPCVLKEGHHEPGYDTDFPRHMDAEQRDRAERYLTHSDPDPARRA